MNVMNVSRITQQHDHFTSTHATTKSERGSQSANLLDVRGVYFSPQISSRNASKVCDLIQN